MLTVLPELALILTTVFLYRCYDYPILQMQKFRIREINNDVVSRRFLVQIQIYLQIDMFLNIKLQCIIDFSSVGFKIIKQLEQPVKHWDFNAIIQIITMKNK